MARSSKSRGRQRGSISRVNPRSYSELARKEPNRPVAVAPAPAPAAAPTPDATTDVVDWCGEYGQVISDLRNLLVISAVLFVLMIVLGFLI